MGAQLTFYSRDDKIFVDNQQGTGRVGSTHELPKERKVKAPLMVEQVSVIETSSDSASHPQTDISAKIPLQDRAC